MMPENFLSKVSHDSVSSRVYLMHLHRSDFPLIITEVDELARKHQYSKLFAKVPSAFAPAFIAAGYHPEAAVPDFYADGDDARFMVKYLSDERSRPEQDALKAFQNLLLESVERKPLHLPAEMQLRALSEQDATPITTVFKQVFESYPFPIFDPAFILKSMREEGTRYFGVFEGDRLIAVSSAECDAENLNAEMTDFAVHPHYRGRKLALLLLQEMENVLRLEGYKTFYTIARLHSLPMNKTFFSMGYKYAGTLNNNTHIAGKIESMNVWYKK